MLAEEKPAHKVKGRYARVQEEGVEAGVCGPWHKYLQGRLFLQRWPGEKVKCDGCYACVFMYGCA